MSIRKELSRLYYSVIYKRDKVRIHSDVLVGRNTKFEGYNTIHSGSIFTGRLGFASNIGKKCKIVGNVGRYCSIGTNVNVETYAHPSSVFVSTHPAFYSLLKQSGFTYVKEQKFDEIPLNEDGVALTIGNDVWIGSNVTIIGGIRIGDGAIIAAGAVVNKDVPPYAIVGGVPARLIRYRFDKDTIQKLEEYKWWEKDKKWLTENADAFVDIAKFSEFFNERRPAMKSQA